MPQIGMRSVRFHFSDPALLDGISFMVEEGERVCLTGRNGAGKSTFLKLLLGQLVPDSGEIIRPPQLRMAYLPQNIPQNVQGTVAQIVKEGARHLLEEGSWKVDVQAEHYLALANLPGETPFSALSGGQKRRVLLAAALASDPEILLLDEPTNHLDISSIDWMEDLLRSTGITLVFITHDRAFLRRMASRILELDRGKLYDWTCDYDTFLVRKQALLEAQEKEWSDFDKKLAQEEAWAKKSPRARRARNEGRMRALYALREERSQRRERQGTAQILAQESSRSGNQVLVAKNISFAYDTRTIIKSCTTTLMRGDKVALLGPNGSGKTTLLKLLLGQLKPLNGSVVLGSSLQILYFDQLRAQIDLEQSVRFNIAQGQEYVSIGGKSKHVMTYLQDFLFDPQRSQVAARVLSGGELNRLLLAKLFTQPANVWVLDEPTNDLDVETLTLLEELLVEFTGTLILVSHDREFLDNVATSVLAINSAGEVEEFVGGWSDWKRQQDARLQKEKESLKITKPVSSNILDTQGIKAKQDLSPHKNSNKPSLTQNTQAAPAQIPLALDESQTTALSKPAQVKSQKLSYKEQKELQELPVLIDRLEAEQKVLHTRISDPEFYKSPAQEISQLLKLQEDLEQKILQAYTRWEELS